MLNKSLLAATLLFAIAGPALSQTAPMPPPQQGGSRPSPFERADANNDGVLTREEVRISRTASFTRLDANRDGFLVREEMPRQSRERRMGNAGRGQENPGSRPRRIIMGEVTLEEADKDKNGTITRAEFDAAWQQQELSNAASISAARTSMFLFLDSDRDGVISTAEMASSTSRKQSFEMRAADMPSGSIPPPRPPRPNAGALTADTNNDQKISLAEWLARPDHLFDQGDANKDGRLTREEAAAVTRQGRITVTSAKRPW